MNGIKKNVITADFLTKIRDFVSIAVSSGKCTFMKSVCMITVCNKLIGEFDLFPFGKLYHSINKKCTHSEGTF